MARQSEGEADLQIIVADNGSTDGTLEMVRKDFPRVELVETGGNLGYGKANNKAFEQARGEYFCALNSDAEVLPGALSTMRDFLESHPQAGAAGPRLIYPDGSPQTSFGEDPTPEGIFQEQTFLGHLLTRIFPPETAPEPEGPTQKPQIVGACQFVRACVYRELGGYDPAFFMYHEDVDLNIRIRRAGWETWYLPQAVVVHHLGASSQRKWQSRARMVSALNWSRYHSFTRNEGAWIGKRLKAYFILGAAIRMTVWTIIALAKPAALDRVRLFRVVFRRAVAMRAEVETPDVFQG